MKVRVPKLELEGFIVEIKGHNALICDEYFKIDSADAHLSMKEATDAMRRAGKNGKCILISGVNQSSEEIEVLEKVPKEWEHLNDLDYSDLSEEFKKYMEKYSEKFTPSQKDLADELDNKLRDLQCITEEIVDLVVKLFPPYALAPDAHDVVSIGPFKIKLQRADANVPIKLDNATLAYFRSSRDADNAPDLEAKLERVTNEFYQVAYRVTQIVDKLPVLASMKNNAVKVVRNQLIEHPEGAHSGVTSDTFSYSKNEGPYVKGLRRGDQLKHMDAEFKANSQSFITDLESSIRKAMEA